MSAGSLLSLADELADSLAAVTGGRHDVHLAHSGLIGGPDLLGQLAARLIYPLAGLGNDPGGPLLRTRDTVLRRTQLSHRRFQVRHQAIVPGKEVRQLTY